MFVWEGVGSSRLIASAMVASAARKSLGRARRGRSSSAFLRVLVPWSEARPSAQL